MDNWTVEQKAKNAHVIRFENVTADWKQHILLTADRHHDNLHTKQQLERQHLELAKERDAPILDFGDLHCAMEGKYDPRKNYDNMRSEYTGNNYFDRLVDVGENFYGPYADQFAVMGYGNHERSILKHNETDLTARLARRLRLRSERDDRAFVGGYSGWIFLRFRIQSTVRQTLKIKYHHGHGGGGPVTKGVIQTNRRAVYLPDADIVVTGHIHEAWCVPITRERVSQAGKSYRDIQWHVSLPTYKDEYIVEDGTGYHIEGGRPPKPLGCAWLILECKNSRVVPKVELDLS